jgi:hypothetical protein
VASTRSARIKAEEEPREPRFAALPERHRCPTVLSRDRVRPPRLARKAAAGDAATALTDVACADVTARDEPPGDPASGVPPSRDDDPDDRDTVVALPLRNKNAIASALADLLLAMLDGRRREP